MRSSKYLVNKLKNNLILNNFKYLINVIFTIIFMISFISVYNKNIKIYFSEINLIIKGNNEQNILSEEFSLEPDQVFVNGVLNNSCKKTCFLNNELNNIVIIFEKKIESCKNLFKSLDNLIEVDLSNFDTSKVTNMDCMFDNCPNLKKITFGNINTSLVENMNNMFHKCESLTTIDLSNFDTSSVTEMVQTFSRCKSLKFIDASKFNTSKVKSMFDIFAYCEELLAVNVSSFDVSNAKILQGIFYNSTKLKYLDLSNFNFPFVDNTGLMFDYCRDLIYLNLYSYELEESNIGIIAFDHSNTKYCFKYLNYQYYEFDNNRILNCSDICFKPNIKVELISNTCIESCNETSSKYEFFNICFDECPDGTYVSTFNEYLCLDKAPEGYYLDLNENIYKKCYDICKKCNYGGNQYDNNCTECKYDLILLNEPINSNCYNKCEYYYYFNESYNNYRCTEINKCPEKYKLIKQKNKCINQCKSDNIYKYEYNISCYEKCPNDTIYENNNFCFLKINYISQEEFFERIQDIIKNNYNISNLTEIEDLTLHNKEKIYTITSTYNQKNNIYINSTTINLADCEEKLKEKYNISQNSSLYMIKIDSFFDGYQIPKVDYEVYYPIKENNMTRLDLSICKNDNIYISMPINISSFDLDKYNASSEYYNDLCNTLKTDDGTDKSLSDRKNEFIINNMTVCEENCKFIDYNYTTKKAVCSCHTKVEIKSIADIKFNTSLLLSNFKDIKNIANFEMLKCIYLMFDKNKFFTNTSNYLMIILLIISIIAIFIFFFKDYSITKNKLYDIYREKKSNEKEKSVHKKIKKQKKNKINLNLNNINEKQIEIKNLDSINNVSNPIRNKKNIESSINEKSKKSQYNMNSLSITNKMYNSSNIININISKEKRKKKRKSKEIFNENMKKNNEIFGYNDYEINNLDYSEAIIYDNRTYFQYYISLIRAKHILIFTFFYNKDYNSKMIKIYIFFFNFLINYTINAMFYSNKIMHKIYIDKGAFNFIYQLPDIIYSSIINIALNAIIKKLGLYGNDIYEIKSLEINGIKKKIKKELKKIKFKIIIFFIITYIFLVFFWLYLGCFCAVYWNTQTHLLKEVLSSVTISMIIPFIIYIFPGIFRIPSLKSKRPFLYKFSKIIQLF